MPKVVLILRLVPEILWALAGLMRLRPRKRAEPKEKIPEAPKKTSS